jgi:hypothetical protein
MAVDWIHLVEQLSTGTFLSKASLMSRCDSQDAIAS